MILTADLHNHSCLSPCGSLEMAPRLLAKTLVAKGVQIAALTDHNSSLNCPAFEIEAKKLGLLALFGIEVQTSEECHILCIFESVKTSLLFSDKIYDLMPPVMNIPEKMGDQVYVDENEDIIGEVDKYLGVSANIDVDGLCNLVKTYNGIIVPAHVDRPAFSLTSQLGLIPKGPWDALEVVNLNCSCDTLGYPIITSSDAHYPENIGMRTCSLDFANDQITKENGNVNLESLRKALSRRPSLN